jgi:hypothetical protein
MIGLGLDVLDVLGIALGKIPHDPRQLRGGAPGEGLELAHGALRGQRLEPGELDAYAVADERLLAEVDAQRVYGPCVSPVERRERGERRGHGALL